MYHSEIRMYENTPFQMKIKLFSGKGPLPCGKGTPPTSHPLPPPSLLDPPCVP